MQGRLLDDAMSRLCRKNITTGKLLSRGGIFLGGLLYYLTAVTQTLPDGDLAPWGAPDGQLNAADLLIMQRLVLEDLVATPLDLLHGDLYPPEAPDSVIDMSDLVLQQRLILGIGPPIATDDPAAASTPEDTAVITANVLANDRLIGNAVVSTFDTISGNAGTVLYNGDGTFTYTPAANFNGTDTFTYTLTNDNGESQTATVTVVVTAANDPPVTTGIPAQNAPRELPFSFQLPGTAFSDPEGDNLTFTATLADDSALPAWLTFSIDTFSGTPGNADVGTLDIKVTASDGNGGQVATTFMLTVPDAIRFAVIGDYGSAGPALAQVAAMVSSWDPDFVTTAGDNNYPDGAAATLDANVGQYFQAFIGNYTGLFGPGASVNRFFPVLGHRDWLTPLSGLPQPYLDYFSLPGNERYYSFTWGNIEFFMLDSDAGEPDGLAFDSAQGLWLQTALAASTAEWQFVCLHRAPLSSGALHGSTTVMQWPFEQWGADAVIAGHNHVYERLAVGGIPYFVNGLGGIDRHGFDAFLPESQAGYNANYGAMLVNVTSTSATFDFYSIAGGGTLIDSYTFDGTPNIAPSALDDVFSVDEDSADNMLTVLADNGNGADSDPESAALTIIAAGTPDHGGTLAINGTGDALTYTPAANFAGTETFSYTISDGILTGSATVSVNVINIDNDAPIAKDDTFIVEQNASVRTLAVLADNSGGADSDPEDDPLSLTAVGIPDNGGSVSINGTADALLYTPLPGFSGNETFTYSVTDGTAIDTATVNILVREASPPLISNVQVTSVTSAEATISWQTDEVTTGSVAYGPGPAYGDGTVTEATAGTEHSITLTGLTGGTQYHFRINALDASNEIGSLDWRHLSSKNGDLPVPGMPDSQVASLLLDVDKDGRSDFVIAAKNEAPAVEWYQQTPGGWVKHLVDDSVLPLEAGGAFYDIDADGDLDIVLGEEVAGNRVYWWENPYPDFTAGIPWTRRLIKDSGATKHHDMLFGDFDADGLDEFLFWNQGANQLLMADIPSDPTTQPWPWEPIYVSGSESEGLTSADIDGNGKVDIVGGGRWFEHQAGAHFVDHVIDDSQRFTRVAAGQLKPGGRPEVVFVAGDNAGRLKWYEWTDGQWVGHDLLGFDVERGHSLAIADLNEDGHLDIFCAEMNLNNSNPDANVWVFYGDGAGNFTQTTVSSGIGSHEARLGDLDNDGDLDILGKPWRWDTPRLDIWLNPHRPSGLSLDNWERHVIDDAKPWRAIFITAHDLDGDTLKDIVTGGWWYRNPGSPAGSWTRNAFGTPLNNMATVFDVDGDFDLDVLGTQGVGSASNADFAWARNDGGGLFTVLTNIPAGNGDFLQGVAVDRFQNGNLEVALSWHNKTALQRLSLPAVPDTDPWILQELHPASAGEALSSGDIDRDSDLDLLLGTQWLRNDGTGWSLQTLDGTPLADRNRLVDVNADGRLDAVVGFEAISLPGKLAWYEQGTTPEAPWSEHLIATITGPMSLDVADLDADGDSDVVAGEHNPADPASARLIVFENTDGQGGSWLAHDVHTGDEHHDGARLTDIDSDGDLDILSIGWSHDRVLLYENKSLDTDRTFVTAGDNTPPVISSIQVTAFENEATVTWSTDELADSSVAYGPSPAYENGAVSDPAPLTAHSITLSGLPAETLFHYQVSSTDISGNTATSTDLSFTTAASTAPPAISTQPATQTVPAGLGATFTVDAAGAAPLVYQWQRDGVDIPGASLASYTTPSTTAADNGAAFTVVVSNAFGSVTSVPAILTVTTATRVTQGLLTLYTLEEGSGTTVTDVSGVGIPLDLVIENPAGTSWVPGGLAITAPGLIASAGAATKIIDAVRTSHALTVEAWVLPANTSQNGPARIVTLSQNTVARNFTLGQGLWGPRPSDLYNVRLRTTTTDNDGKPSLSTAAGTLSLTLTHVIYTRDATGLVKLYLDGVEQAGTTVGGDLSNWAIDHRLGFANEMTGDRPWLGELHLVAFYDRALSSAEVTQNFNAGPE